MKATVTLKVKLETIEQVAQSLAETQVYYAAALNHTSDVAFEKRVFNPVALHHVTYQVVRELTKLPANLVCSARNVVKEIPDSTSDGVIGVDSGIKRIATVNTGKIFKGGTIKHIRERNFKQRRDLQAARHKSRNQRRLLKRLAGKEKRSVDWLLWNVASEIVKEALKEGAGTIAIEDLKGIRIRIKCAKKQRLIMHGWPFSSLFAKIRHVASKHGIKVESVDARNTSRTCRCGHVDKANRTTQSTFRCVVCGYSHNADYVASHNVAARYVEQRCGIVTCRSESAASSRAKKTALL